MVAIYLEFIPEFWALGRVYVCPINSFQIGTKGDRKKENCFSPLADGKDLTILNSNKLDEHLIQIRMFHWFVKKFKFCF